MKIRSITTFLNPGWPLNASALHKAGEFIAQARQAFQTAGYEVQTTRLASVPFPLLLGEDTPSEALSFAQALESATKAQGYDYLSIGPAQPEFQSSYRVIPRILAQTEHVFAGGVIATADCGISLPAIRACAEIIHQLSPVDPHGFGNLYFAALANVPPGAPFFPAAYHDNGPPGFALATEAADLAVEAFTSANSLQQARQQLITQVEAHARSLSQIANGLAEHFALRFLGIDFSLAPFPEETQSIGTALERMGVPKVGMAGSLATTAILADTLDQADFPRTGFSGLMLPVLEDATLARRAREGILTVKDLLLFSAVCGTGLDTIPLPGDTTADQLAAILLDLAALALRLDKPLTARLMPIPGKSSGEPTDFDFPFFANSRVMATEGDSLRGLLAGEESFQLAPRHPS
jgi:hypothetical protein